MVILKGSGNGSEVGEALQQFHCRSELVLFLGRQLRLQGAEEPIFFGGAAGLDGLSESGRQGDERFPAIGWVWLATDRPNGFQAGHRDAHGLRTHALGPGERGDGCGPVAIETQENRLLGGGEVAGMRLLPQPPNQLADGNTQLTSKSGQFWGF